MDTQFHQLMNRNTYSEKRFFSTLCACLIIGLFGNVHALFAQSEVVFTEEAEQGMIDGGVIQEIDGFVYYELQDSSILEWPFDIATDGTYNLILGTRLTSGTKAQYISLNGMRFKNQAFPGEEGFVFDANVLGEEWVNYQISPDTISTLADMGYGGPEILSLSAGSHTLRIESAEGLQEFSGFALVHAASADTAATGTALNAVSVASIPKCDESEYCPSGFKSVALREGAFLTFNIPFPENGSYQLHIAYNAPNGGSSDLLIDWNAVVEDMSFNPEENEFLTGLFEGEAGNRSLTFDTERGGFNIDYIQLIKVSETSTSIEDHLLTDGFSLASNYPNPFTTATTISYTLDVPSPVTISVYDALGRLVDVITKSDHPAGTFQVSWDGHDTTNKQVAGGIYFYKMESNSGIKTQRMVFLPE